MRIHLPIEIKRRLAIALKKGDSREIGGILMGEHIGEAEFRIVDLTIQTESGSVASFFRLVSEAVASLWRFFRRIRNNYRKFNYLGEWHSHPLFSPVASQGDIQSMQEIAADPDIGANFVILLVVKLERMQELEATAMAFLPNGAYCRCELRKE